MRQPQCAESGNALAQPMRLAAVRAPKVRMRETRGDEEDILASAR
ncbi:MAG: hypothetical protein AVDCRST_MAG59-2785 [uncultured Thermomicrobiales bacterium]|uniref:Uncharacterized protein n=1 Tax=uncultured Thermomicrobiales bacterium TaxID=1645740 RepID=A0A6J4V0H6_9BACT|nr:MAG: hypothetical protein AVDCRST_MAG59-2785 [uncultured Thermomicrobiales bacterium]